MGTSVPMSGPVFACVRVPQCLTQALCPFPKKPMSESQHSLGEPDTPDTRDTGSKSAHVRRPEPMMGSATLTQAPVTATHTSPGAGESTLLLATISYLMVRAALASPGNSF